MANQSDRERTPWIFLCHASEDKPQVAELYHRLKAAGYHPWLDKYNLLPGQDWWREIEKIIRDPYNLVLVCLSSNSVTKRGVVQREIKRALDVLDEMPEDTIYLIPTRLELCEAPDRLSYLHWVDLFEPDGFDNLKQSLDFEITKRQPFRQSFEPELILIPAGEFLMGSDPQKDERASKYEQPQHRLSLPDYYIAKTPVTNTQYAAFVQASGHLPPKHWKGSTKPPKSIEDHPVVNVSWEDGVAYCRWLVQVTGKPYRLPTEAEWEKAARGLDGRIYPWGNKWDAARCNTSEGGEGGTTPVGAYPAGASPYRVLDMAGNVWERCATKWGKPYPYDVTEDEWMADYLKAGEFRVLRGGAWDRYRNNARCADRFRGYPNYRDFVIGFRVVVSPIL